MKAFKSIIEFQKVFGTDEACRLYLEEQRWGGTPACPHCGSTDVCRFKTDVKIFKCRDCRKKFSVTVGTVYQDRKLPLHKIFLAVYILSTHSKGISSLQLASFLDISQKAAWLLNHKVRSMLTEKAPVLLSEVVEVDETFVGGKHKNRHEWKKEEIRLAGFKDKTMVVGLVQRGKDGKNSKVRTTIAKDVTKETLQNMVRENVAKGATVYTDELNSYKGLQGDYSHDAVGHAAKEYVRGKVHTNSIEGYWSLLKRQIVGIHHQVSPKHLQRYCNEASFRYNNKGVTQDVKFADALQNCEGVLQWKELIK
jgi:transposase-like protein